MPRKLRRVSEEMQHLSTVLAQELLAWPNVSMRPMFGMHAFYRGTTVFAMLPHQRTLSSEKAIAYKLSALAGKEGEKWRYFELEGEHLIPSALANLNRAYREALARKVQP